MSHQFQAGVVARAIRRCVSSSPGEDSPQARYATIAVRRCPAVVTPRSWSGAELLAMAAAVRSRASFMP